jgi:hypothetical protein
MFQGSSPDKSHYRQLAQPEIPVAENTVSQDLSRSLRVDNQFRGVRFYHHLVIVTCR